MTTLFDRLAETVDRHIGAPWTFVGVTAVTLAGTAGLLVLLEAGQVDLVNAIDNALGAVTGVAAILLLVLMSAAANRREAEAERRDVAMHAKLDELLRAVPQAENALIAAEERSTEELRELREHLVQAVEPA